MSGLREAEMQQLKPLPVVQGEVVDNDEFEDPEGDLLSELKASRDCLRNCMIFMQYYGNFVQKITKREVAQIEKVIERIENRLDEMDEVLDQYAEDE